MIKLKQFEVCRYSTICPYNNQQGPNFCVGADPKRDKEFTCDYFQDGTFVEGKFRSSYDETGKMKVILEGNVPNDRN